MTWGESNYALANVTLGHTPLHEVAVSSQRKMREEDGEDTRGEKGS